MLKHSQMSDTDLFTRYVDICNQAILLNKDRFPFKQILGAGEKAGKGQVIEVHLEDGKDQMRFALEIQKGLLTAKAHSACEKCNCTGNWSVTRNYIEEVVADPDPYIMNPAKIDWGWMVSGNA